MIRHRPSEKSLIILDRTEDTLGVSAPSWKIDKKGDCKKILISGVAEGLSEFKLTSEKEKQDSDNQD